MKIGWIGLGKLGLPCALVLAEHHEVVGYDVNSQVSEFLAGKARLPWVEPGVEKLLAETTLTSTTTVTNLVARSDVIFVAVQTPHAPAYGGETPLPEETRDFEYGYLVQAVRDVARAALQQERQVTLAVVSTVLPGTTDRLLRPLLNAYVQLVYSPQFVAMGQTIHDFKHPEFILVGGDDHAALEKVVDCIEPVISGPKYPPVVYTSITSAELIKVAYNTFISMKIVWANHIMAICAATGADADDISAALQFGTHRITSSAYTRGGMGDGGACHPRDLIALADLERRLNLPGFFHGLATMRDLQSEWLADVVVRWHEQTELPIIVLGKTYKPNVTLTDGSPALLLVHHLRERKMQVSHHDPLLDGDIPTFTTPILFVIATNHPGFAERIKYPLGSVVIDPWGFIPDQQGVTVVRIGRR